MSSTSLAENKIFDLSPKSFEQALQLAKILSDSDLVPKDYKGKEANCLVAIQWGAELGMKPMQALQNIAVIGGRPSLWGDSVSALVRSSPVCEYIREEYSPDGESAICRVKRRGDPEHVSIFSMQDAQMAGLAGKTGPWTTYPKRMLKMRARAFALRDVFPDVLRGMPIAEELQDTPRDMGMVEEVDKKSPQPAHLVPTNTSTADVWPEDSFNNQFPRWEKAIQSGVKSNLDIIALAESKGSLTKEQRTKIMGVKQKPAEPPAAAPSAPEQQQSPETNGNEGDAQ